MEHILVFLSQFISTSALLVIIYVFSGLSRRLGEAMQVKPFYHLFTISSVLFVFALLVQMYLILNLYNLANISWLQLIVLENILLLIGVILSLFSVLKYWGWLFKEIC